MPAEQKPSSLGPRLPEAPQPFEHVISLGSSCAVSLFLRQQRLRVLAGPFDWTFSSVRMVAACLDDDFACFLDPAQYAPLRQQQRLHPMYHGCSTASPRLQPLVSRYVLLPQNRVGHRRFSEMIEHSVIFNHHCPLARADHEHFRRCAARQPTHAHRCPRTLHSAPRHVRNTRSSE